MAPKFQNKSNLSSIQLLRIWLQACNDLQGQALSCYCWRNNLTNTCLPLQCGDYSTSLFYWLSWKEKKHLNFLRRQPKRFFQEGGSKTGRQMFVRVRGKSKKTMHVCYTPSHVCKSCSLELCVTMAMIICFSLYSRSPSLKGAETPGKTG